MKKLLIIAALIVINSAAFAIEDEPRTSGLAIVPVKGSQIFKVVYKGETSGKVKLTVYNAKGQLIFTEYINKSAGFIRPLNFSGLSAGEYTIELVDATGKKIEKVIYQPKSSIKQIHISKIASETDKYILAVTNSGAEKITVNIFDNNNNLVYTESKNIKGDFAQVYKLEANAASYTFQVTDTAGNIKTVSF